MDIDGLSSVIPAVHIYLIHTLVPVCYCMPSGMYGEFFKVRWQLANASCLQVSLFSFWQLVLNNFLVRTLSLSGALSFWNLNQSLGTGRKKRRSFLVKFLFHVFLLLFWYLTGINFRFVF